MVPEMPVRRSVLASLLVAALFTAPAFAVSLRPGLPGPARSWTSAPPASAALAEAGAAQAPQAPVRVGGRIPAPKKIKDVPPVYPQEARDARVQGVVIIEATIDGNGLVSDAKVLRSIKLLDQAALDAVRQWEYTPTLLNGEPVSIIMSVTVTFTLSAEGDSEPRN